MGVKQKKRLHGGCPPIKGIKWSANVWIWNRPSPDKSKAKDIPTPEESDQLSISFLNTREFPVKIFWDSTVPEFADDKLDLAYFTAEFNKDVDHKRFVEQMDLPARRESELTSYSGHLFIAVNPDTNEVLWNGVVRNLGQLMEI